MKTISKRNTLSLKKFQIAKLNNLNTIVGGKAAPNNTSDNEEENFPTTTDTWTTLGG
jgi:hypothetical protein